MQQVAPAKALSSTNYIHDSLKPDQPIVAIIEVDAYNWEWHTIITISPQLILY